MFTGIIQEIGTVRAVEKKGDWIVTIGVEKALWDKTALGGSIACSGICLTVLEKGDHFFKAQVSPETLSVTTAAAWSVGTRLNLEPALRLGDELGGHMVSGHVDGIALCVGRHMDGESVRLRFRVPSPFKVFIAPKGSVTLDGVSLTVNEVDGEVFGVNLIPHTQKETTLGSLREGDNINFEIDLLARYIKQMMAPRT